jgi:hypothetical protein
MTDTMNLGKQIGPLPLGVWLGVGAVGLGIGYYINRKAGAANANAPIPLPNSDVGVGGSGFDVVNPPASNTTVTTPDESNQTWGRKAANWLISEGKDPGTADNAVRKYLYGENLTLLEQSYINLVLLKFGLPPEPIQPVEIPVPPTGGGGDTGALTAVTGLAVASTSATSVDLTWNPVAGAARYRIRTEEPAGPTARIPDRFSMDTRHTIAPLGLNIGYRFYVAAVTASGTAGPEASVSAKTGTLAGVGFARAHIVSTGETLSGIAMRYYGNGSAAKVNELYAANRGTIEAAARENGKTTSDNGFFLFPGTVLHIP